MNSGVLLDLLYHREHLTCRTAVVAYRPRPQPASLVCRCELATQRLSTNETALVGKVTLVGKVSTYHPAAHSPCNNATTLASIHTQKTPSRCGRAPNLVVVRFCKGVSPLV